MTDLGGRPIVLLARGGSGSRLLSQAAQDLGVHLGRAVNVSGDSIDMALPIYQAVIGKLGYRSRYRPERTVERLRHAARPLSQGAEDGIWGFKLPEAMYIVPEIDAAFPDARLVHLIRDPRRTCLRRTHLTARISNRIGRVTVPAAYGYCGRDPLSIEEDSPAMHMALTTIHQLEQVTDYGRSLPEGRYLEVRFEDLIAQPKATRGVLARWLGLREQGGMLEECVDPGRAEKPDSPYDDETAGRVTSLLDPLRRKLGYGSLGSPPHPGAVP